MHPTVEKVRSLCSFHLLPGAKLIELTGKLIATVFEEKVGVMFTVDDGGGI